MSIIKLETKNIRTLATGVAIGFVATAILVWFQKAGYFDYSYSAGSPSPYLTALQPILFAGIPITLVASFIFGVFTATREDLPTARLQASILIFIILILAYVFSFVVTSGPMGGF